MPAVLDPLVSTPSAATIVLAGVPLARQPVGSTLLVAVNITQAGTTTFVDPTIIDGAYRIGADGVISPLTLTRNDVGAYAFVLPLTAAGVWYLRVSASGSYLGAAESEVVVIPSAFS